MIAVIVVPWGMDLSMPSASVILSDAVGAEYQSVVASVLMSTVNYDVSIALGFAGTVASEINPDGRPVLQGYREAIYVGISLGGLRLRFLLLTAK